MYPAGLPGVLLIFVRLTAAAALIFTGNPGWVLSTSTSMSVARFIVMICILLGLLARWAALAASLLLLQSGVHAHGSAFLLFCIAFSAMAAVAILGPGAYSIDSLMYGRRRKINFE